MTSRNRVKSAMRNTLFGLFLTAATTAAEAYETALTAPGAPEELQERLTGASAVMGAEASGLTTVQELLAAALSDYRTMVQVLYDEGYFSPVVNIRLDGREAASVQPLHLPRQVNKIEVTVQTGPKFVFGRADVGPLAPGTEIPETYRSGATATTGAIRDAASAGVTGWRYAGHAKARVGDQKITANHLKSRLDADIRLSPGPRLRFGKMTLTGQSDVRPDSIRAIAGFPTGEVYDPDKLQKTATRLRRTGAFSTVALREAETPNADGTLDVEATFEDLPKRYLSFGAELSSSEGLDLSAIWMHRNLFGGADRFRFEARIGNIGGSEDIDGRLAVRLDQPDKLGPDDSLYYTFEIERLNREHFSSWRTVAGVGVRRVFSDYLYGELALAASYSVADDAFGTDRKFRYVALPGKLEWDRRDNPVDARNGFFLSAQLTPYAGISGTESGARAYVDGRGYMSLGGSGRVVLAGRLQVGSIVGSSQAGTSPDLLFFSGGAGSVRGQPYESLGIPVPPAGNIAGGRSFLGASMELRGQITEKIWLVGFYDYGSVDADSFVDTNSPYHSGAGLGVRYDLGGFGPIRFDLAYPVDGSTGDGLQFYIGIGQAF